MSPCLRVELHVCLYNLCGESLFVWGDWQYSSSNNQFKHNIGYPFSGKEISKVALSIVIVI